jgi:uncharacterized membrane protein
VEGAAEGDLGAAAFQAGAADSEAAAQGEAGERMSWLYPIPKVSHERVVAAIRDAEAKTSGEIRVVVARHKASDPVAAAQTYFKKFGMAKVADRNGVLIFVAPRSRIFAVIGDTGIHSKCGDAAWASIASAMGERFKGGEFTDGIVHGVQRAGELLAESFPR